MFRVTRYPMISKTESGRVGYRKKYRVAGRVRVPAEHWYFVCIQSVPGQLVCTDDAVAASEELLEAGLWADVRLRWRRYRLYHLSLISLI